MKKSSDWLYFHYILPILEEENQGEYAENITRLKSLLDLHQTTDFELAIEFYATCAFRLGLRTEAMLRQLLTEE